MLRLSALALVVTLAWAGVTAASARADVGVIPDTPDLPWSDPAHNTALEHLASDVASQIAQRPVRAYCNGQADWDALATRAGFDASLVWGYVNPPRYWYPSLGTWAESSTHTHLSEQACERLWLYAKATVKQTKCAASRMLTETVSVKVRYQVTVRVKVKKRVKVNGRWVTRYVREKRRVWRTRAEQRNVTRSVAIDPRPCYGDTEADVHVASPDGGWPLYAEYAFAIATLAHESVHLLSLTAGRPVPASVHEEESRAECWGMQLIPRVAIALGAAPDDAYSVSAWYADEFYPGRETSFPDYWSVDCKSSGALDLSPGDGRWP